MYEKEIVYDPETRDFEMRLDGELVGFARTYQEAEQTLDELVYDLLNSPTVYRHEPLIGPKRRAI